MVETLENHKEATVKTASKSEIWAGRLMDIANTSLETTDPVKLAALEEEFHLVFTGQRSPTPYLFCLKSRFAGVRLGL